MNTKLKIEKMAEAINYYDVQNSFYKKNGDELSIDDLLAKGMDEDDFPWNIKDFKKLGYGFSKAEFYCTEDNKEILYSFSNDEKSIIIDSENFSLKEFIIIVDDKKTSRSHRCWAIYIIWKGKRRNTYSLP